MSISFHNGVSGMLASQEGMNRISHNIANSGTVGFKPERSEFESLLYSRMAVNSSEEPMTGHGTRIGELGVVMRQGAVISTGRGTDFALMGDGFFAVKDASGEIKYTRSGNFHISVERERRYLVSADGSHVLDSKGKAIEVPGDNVDFYSLSEEIGIYDFPNPFGLMPQRGSMFKPTDNSGEAEAIKIGKVKGERKYQVISGALEQSAVELSDEMVNVILTQKNFQLSAKVVQTSDEMEQVINNLR